MADNPGPQMAVPPDQGWQWAFSYLRQDIQDVRAEIRDLRAQLAEMGRRMDRHLTITLSTVVAIGGLLAALIRL